MNNLLNQFLSIFLIILIFLCFTISSIAITDTELNNSIIYSSEFVWPLSGYTKISSYYGKRKSPTGASSFHSGIDIPAPEGTPIKAICSGKVTFCSWGAGGGYTIVIENEIYKVSYCHVSPIFIVKKGDYINVGTIISSVGPKNVYGIKNNPYKDSNGNPTNGATTGCHLHLSIRKNRNTYRPTFLLSTKRFFIITFIHHYNNIKRESN